MASPEESLMTTRYIELVCIASNVPASRVSPTALIMKGDPGNRFIKKNRPVST